MTIYTPGCHAGLNVPPTDSAKALDLVQAFAGKGATAGLHRAMSLLADGAAVKGLRQQSNKKSLLITGATPPVINNDFFMRS